MPDEAEKAAMARLAVEIGRQDLKDCTLLFHPETLFRWHRELVRVKFDGSTCRKPGRPSTWRVLWDTVERFAKDNPTWGSARIQGQLQALGFGVSEPSVRRIMRRLGFNPKPEPNKRWSDFLERHKASIVATDFFTYEAWTPQGLKSLFVLFFIQPPVPG
ncbi:MAG: IS3 family transposase [bacterium]